LLMSEVSFPTRSMIGAKIVPALREPPSGVTLRQ